MAVGAVARAVQGTGVRTLPLQVGCVLMLAAIWALDLASPQLFVVAILLTAPIALSGLALRPRFTLGLSLCALVADASAAWYNAYHESYHWQPVAVGDRLLAAFAIILVGALTVNAQRAALRSAQLSDQSTRSEAIRDVIYALSHDLRTPIMAARMTMRQALGGAYGELPERYRAILQSSIASNEELHRLAETLLLVARYESGEESSVRDEVDLAEISADVVRELQALAQAKRIELTADLTAAPVHVMGDAGELKRALTNLVANAVTSTPQDGHILVALKRAEGNAQIAVTDDGYGIPEANVPQLFERFSPVARKGAGLGLGLYIVRRIAQAHGGAVRYEPAQPRGSVFSLELPLYNRARDL